MPSCNVDFDWFDWFDWSVWLFSHIISYYLICMEEDAHFPREDLISVRLRVLWYTDMTRETSYHYLWATEGNKYNITATKSMRPSEWWDLELSVDIEERHAIHLCGSVVSGFSAVLSFTTGGSLLNPREDDWTSMVIGGLVCQNWEHCCSMTAASVLTLILEFSRYPIKSRDQEQYLHSSHKHKQGVHNIPRTTNPHYKALEESTHVFHSPHGAITSHHTNSTFLHGVKCHGAGNTRGF